MSQPILTGAALLTLAAGTAQADVTAQEVWEDWVAALETGEATLSTGSVDEGDGRLTITDLTLSSEMEEGSYSVAIDEIVLEENPDGSVTVTLSPTYPISVEARDDEGQRVAFTVEVSHPDLEMTVSGDEAGRTHAYAAPELSIELVEATQDGEPLDLALAGTLAGVEGRYTVSGDETARYGSEMSAERLTLEVSGADPEAGGTFDVALEMADLETDNATSMLDVGMTDLPAALRDGLQTEGRLAYGPLSYSVAGEGEDGQFAMEGGAEGGELKWGLSEDGLVYGSRSTDARLVFSGDQVPLPQVAFEMAESESAAVIPLLAQEAPQDFALVLRLVDLSMSEDVWSMLDPAGVLPRDPATLVVDLSGTARLDQDLAGEEVGADGAPGAFETLSIDELRIAALGADLTGTGDLAFTASGADAAAGMPQPEGRIELQLTGANTLLDRLVTMGLVPEDQATGARMMLGLFARPAEGDDALTSTIEFGADGQITANGQRIR